MYLDVFYLVYIYGIYFGFCFLMTKRHLSLLNGKLLGLNFTLFSINIISILFFFVNICYPFSILYIDFPFYIVLITKEM